MSNYRNKEWLKQEYIQKGKTAAEIAGPEGCCPQAILYWLGRFGIKTRKPIPRPGVMSGEKHPYYGKSHSAEIRTKMSAAHKGRWLGKRHPNEGRNHSSETRAKMRAAHTDRLLKINGQGWNGEKRKKSNGYFHSYAPDHPNTNGAGFVPEHRLIAEKALGRFLKKKELVHHINEDRADNQNSNLLICTRAYHLDLHQRMRKAAADG